MVRPLVDVAEKRGTVSKTVWVSRNRSSHSSSPPWCAERSRLDRLGVRRSMESYSSSEDTKRPPISEDSGFGVDPITASSPRGTPEGHTSSPQSTSIVRPRALLRASEPNREWACFDVGPAVSVVRYNEAQGGWIYVPVIPPHQWRVADSQINRIVREIKRL
jgi:hypothetical protein